MIPYGKQSIDDSDLEAVCRALHADYLTTGPEVASFEEEFAQMVGAEYAVAVCNATAALHLAMRVAGLGPGDRVVTSPNTFLASANCAAFVGATPDFSDIEPVGYNLDPEKLDQNWQADTKAVVAVDYAGQAANMPRIAEVARARGAVVIEDACHGVGGGFSYQDKEWKLGGHLWADMTTFSFHPVKTMTTGEGGMLVTDNEEYAVKARLLRNHGMTREPSDFLPSDLCPLTSEHGPWYYEMQELGYNYRITDIQCALGRSQLKRLPEFIRRRQEIVDQYNEAFKALDYITTPKLAPWLLRGLDTRHSTPDTHISWHLYTVQIDFKALGKSRTIVMEKLRDKGVGTQVLYIPVHLQPWYRNTYGYGLGKCPQAEAFYMRTLSLPLFPGMTNRDVDTVVEALSDVMMGDT